MKNKSASQQETAVIKSYNIRCNCLFHVLLIFQPESFQLLILSHLFLECHKVDSAAQFSPKQNNKQTSLTIIRKGASLHLNKK